MNVYRYRTPKVPDAIAQNISIRLRGVINGSDFTETQGAALIDICEECWKSGWQNGHFLMNQQVRRKKLSTVILKLYMKRCLVKKAMGEQINGKK